MTTREFISNQVSKLLLEIDAVSININKPYTLTSGRISPVYVDCRKIISFPQIRQKIIQYLLEILNQVANGTKFELIVGGETAGIPYASWISEKMSLPMAYIRKQAKGFGRNARIEGCFNPGMETLLVEDLATDGGSKINFIQALRNVGLEAKHALVIFYYNTFTNTVSMLEAANIHLHYLATWADILRECESSKQLNRLEIKVVNDFLDDPIKWDQLNK